MEKAKKLASGNWRVRVWYTDGSGARHAKSFTASTRKEAEYAAADFEMRKEHLANVHDWTLGDAIDAYIDLKRPVLAPSTIHGYERMRQHNFQDIMDIPIRKMTNEILSQAVAREMARKPKNKKDTETISSKSVKNAYGLVSAALRRYNPGYVYKVDLPKKPRRIRSLPLPEDIHAAVKGSDVELACLLAMWLSFSESEIRGLTKSKSIDGDYITIREVVVYFDGEDHRKDMAKEETRNRRHRIPPYIKNLIDQVDGDVLVPLPPHIILGHFQTCLKKAGLPQMTFHDLRHVNATLMATLRIPDNYAQERGGWKTDHVMKTVYTEVFSSERERIDDIIDAYFTERLQ